MLDKIRAYGFQALALALLALSIYLGFQIYEARLDAEKSRSALSAEQTSRARESAERMRVARKPGISLKRSVILSCAETKALSMRSLKLLPAVDASKLGLA
mgnify:CR=1 FL=1